MSAVWRRMGTGGSGLAQRDPHVYVVIGISFRKGRRRARLLLEGILNIKSDKLVEKARDRYEEERSERQVARRRTKAS